MKKIKFNPNLRFFKRKVRKDKTARCAKKTFSDLNYLSLIIHF